MPIPKPTANEDRDVFISRCMGDPLMESEYADRDQRFAVCSAQYKGEFAKEFYWKAFDRKRRSLEMRSQLIAERAFKQQGRLLEEAILDSQTPSEVSRGVEEALDPEIITNMLTQIYVLVGSEFALNTFRNFKSFQDIETKQDEALINNWGEIMRAYISVKGGEKIIGISKENLRVVRRILAVSAAQGLSIPNTAKEFRSQWSTMTKARAVRIARTELISASNKGAIEGARSTGIPMQKEWISTRDTSTRQDGFDHVTPDGQLVDLNVDFLISEETLEHPGDPSGSPGNVINCRCTVGFKPLR